MKVPAAHLARRVAPLALLVLLGAGSAPAQVPAGPDLSTPERALRAFLDASRAGDFARAAGFLDLGALPQGERGWRGPQLARRLSLVLDTQLWVDLDAVSDDPAGDPADGAGVELVGTVPVGSRAVPVRLARAADGAWRFGPGTVATIDALYAAHGPGWLADQLPPELLRWRWLEVEAWQWLGLVLGGLLAVGLARLVTALVLAVARRVTRRTRVTWDDELVVTFAGPLRLLAALAAFGAVARLVHLAVPADRAVTTWLSVLSTMAFTWAGVRAVGFVASLLEARFTGGVEPAAARGVRTQVVVLRRVAGVVVVVLGGALVLMQFDGLRALGTSVLASAGVVGLAVGFAAQRSLSTLLAGLQLSMTQPVRVGDVVIVEGEWGTVEEITLTYVVVRIWDLRRLVVPIHRFLEAPFQNWTRSSTELLGTVSLHADYRVPVQAVREELARFVASQAGWDRKVVGLQVTGATDRTVELRALVSAPDASTAWDLRCAVREHLVDWLQRLEGGRYLPRTRLETDGAPGERPQVGGRAVERRAG